MPLDFNRIEEGENLTTEFNMIKASDGDKYEEARALNQELTFTETAREFGFKNIEFGSPQMMSLKFVTTEGIFTNLGLLLSDQSVHTVKLAVFEGLEKEIFKDRREFSGSLIKQLNDVYIFLVGLSVPRNDNLANIFYRLHLIEAYGTGIPKIMRSYADCEKKPELQTTANAFKITLPILRLWL